MSKIDRREAIKGALKVGAAGLTALSVGEIPLLASEKHLAAPQTVTPAGEFPKAGTDKFLSHFIIAIRFLKGNLAGQLITLSLPAAAQTVARSEPFIYRGPNANHSVNLPLPSTSKLSSRITEKDFFVKPPHFFTPGQEHVWLQIVDIDAKTDTAAGPIRIILGDTFKREYPDLFEHSLGLAESIGPSGFPARLFFSPNSIIETPFGNFKTRAGKALVGERITQFPPLGSAPTLLEPVPIDSVEDLRSAKKAAEAHKHGGVVPVSLNIGLQTDPSGSIDGLAHPIDSSIST